MQNVKRGECYFIMKGDAVTGSEQDKRKEIDDIKVTFCGKECDKCLN